MDKFGLVQHVTQQTHIRGNILDLIITHPANVSNDVSVDPSVFSDNNLIICFFAFTKPAPPVLRSKVIRWLNNIENDAFNAAIQQFDICALPVNMAGGLLSHLCTLYTDSLRGILDNFAPPTTITVSDRIASPWFDGKCRACRMRVRALERNYRRFRLSGDKLTWLAALMEKLQNCAGDFRQLWRHLNCILLRDTALLTHTASLIAQTLTTFFVDKVTKVRAATELYQPATYTGPRPSHFDNISHYNVEDIRRFILDSPKKSFHLDPLPHSLLITSLDCVLPRIHLISNRFM